MPDLQNFVITRGTAANLSVVRYTISGTVNDSKTGAVLLDFTGANAVSFPAVLGNLTAAERDELIQLIALWLLQKRFPGLWA